MAGFVLCSHDGFGLGHVRRHVVVARALRELAPRTPIVIVTGLPFVPRWLAESGFEIVRLPAIIKDASGCYQPLDADLPAALCTREELFARTVELHRPDVVLVDRHPFGTDGELRAGLQLARDAGARAVLGLRDILDDRQRIRAETAGPRWAGAADVFDEAIVYGAAHFCDHHAEYQVPLPLRYVGWAVEVAEARSPVPGHLTVTSGGGADGYELFELGISVVEQFDAWRLTIVAGNYVEESRLTELVERTSARDRIEVLWRASGCSSVFSRTAATLQMAGYNSTFEAIAAGRRPILVPRCRPRTEQAIRAARLDGLGLANAVRPEGLDDVCRLLERSRLLPAGRAERLGISFDGAQRAALALLDAQRRATPRLQDSTVLT